MCRSLLNFWYLQYHSGVEKEGNVYKGIVAFMVVRLKQSTPFVVQAIPQARQANPEVTFNGQWLAEKLSVRKVLLVLRNVKEQKKQYAKSFFFFMEVPNMKYSDRMVLKYR